MYHSTQKNKTWHVTKSLMKRDFSCSIIALTPSCHYLDAASLCQHPHPDRLLLLSQGDPLFYRETVRLQGLNARTFQSGASYFKFTLKMYLGEEWWKRLSFVYLVRLTYFSSEIFLSQNLCFGRNPLTMHLKIMLYVLQ